MLHENKAIELEGLVDFKFNPTKNLIAYFCGEKVILFFILNQIDQKNFLQPNANSPAEFGILEIPSRQKIRTLRIFSVFLANLFWQEKSGSYLAVHTERYQKMIKGKDGDVNKYTVFTFEA